jgi:hypothetical protein
MQKRLLLLVSASLLLNIACDKIKSEPDKPAVSASAAADPAKPTTAATSTTQAQAASATSTTEGAHGGTPPVGSAVTGLQNGDTKLTAAAGPNGSSLNLQNDAGKGSITTSSGGVQIQGKNGTIAIPTNVPGLPVAK